MGERPILGLRVGEPVSLVRDKRDLHTLLTQVSERQQTNIDGILRVLASATGKEIPVEFLLKTGLDELFWYQIYHHSALSAVYLGARKEPTEPLSFPDAEALVAIHSDVVDGNIAVKRVELAATVEDSNGRLRAVNAHYSLGQQLYSAAAVSIAEGEKQKPYYWSTREDQIRSVGMLKKIPFDIADRFLLPFTLLVSARMSQLASGDVLMVEATALGDKWHTRFEDYSATEDGSDNLIISRELELDNPIWTVSLPANLVDVK